jgi:hypothetical protein
VLIPHSKSRNHKLSTGRPLVLCSVGWQSVSGFQCRVVTLGHLAVFLTWGSSRLRGGNAGILRGLREPSRLPYLRSRPRRGDFSDILLATKSRVTHLLPLAESRAGPVYAAGISIDASSHVDPERFAGCPRTESDFGCSARLEPSSRPPCAGGRQRARRSRTDSGINLTALGDRRTNRSTG